jgi:hypothetical protein
MLQRLREAIISDQIMKNEVFLLEIRKNTNCTNFVFFKLQKGFDLMANYQTLNQIKEIPCISNLNLYIQVLWAVVFFA